MSSENKFTIGEAIGFGWETVKKNLWFWIGISVIYLVLTSLNVSFKQDSVNYQVSSIISGIFGIILSIGLVKISLKFIDGKKAEYKDLFTSYRLFWKMLGAQILIGLIVFAGFLLLIVPGIIWSIKYQFAPNFIVDKDMKIMEAMKASAVATEGIKWQLFVLSLAFAGIMILGMIALGIGILVAFPIIWIADCFVYRKLSKSNNKTEKVETEAAPAE